MVGILHGVNKSDNSYLKTRRVFDIHSMAVSGLSCKQTE